MQQQAHDEVEYIIIDGGSTDLTRSVICKNRVITQSVSEPDQGIYDALNKGIQRATGDVIGFVHSDDILFGKQTFCIFIQ